MNQEIEADKKEQAADITRDTKIATDASKTNTKTEKKRDQSPIMEKNPYENPSTEPNEVHIGKTKTKNLSIVTTDFKDVPNILRKDPTDEAQSELQKPTIKV